MGVDAQHVPAIECRGLRKLYGSKVAVASVDLIVPQGIAFGFLGPNGAGKTTTIKMLLGFVKPTSGSFLIFGRRLDLSVRQAIGFLPEHFRFPLWHTPRSLLRFHAKLARLPQDRTETRIDQVLQMVGLADRSNDALSRFSKGMLQRVGIAQAIIAEPRLLFLDEPTSGLDPVGRHEVKQLIRVLKGQGVTVFLNTHILADVEAVCDQVAIIDRGQVLASGRPDQLSTHQVAVDIRLRPGKAPVESVFEGLPHRWDLDSTVHVTLSNEEEIPDLVAKLAAAGARIYEVRHSRLSLEEVFVRLVRGDQA